ncbi:MAG: ATP-dependent DNA helicase RecG, partial [Acidimicrobiia bacterium]
LERVRDVGEDLPAALLTSERLPLRADALAAIHRPRSLSEAEVGRVRLAFDELLVLRLALLRTAAARERASALPLGEPGELIARYRESLPFTLTPDQERATTEIDADLDRTVPMQRLLQGDVGSGKTVVAFHALLVAVQGGHQGAFMAPTEILAEQHYLGSRELLAGLSVPDSATLTGDRPVRVELLTNRTSAADRRRLAAALKAREVDIVIGTHALIYGEVEFASLGVVVIDEQHRFGVEQREVLRGLGNDPDVLVMTATPIPRTAAMLVYGDLDKSELRELPPGRVPIATEVVGDNALARAAVHERLRAEVASGRQAYVVCPLVGGSDRTEARAAVEEFARLGDEELAGLRLGLLHGQLPSREKEAVMAAFRAGELDVLVATTVVEVGVDVPNATVMVVEDADRFGLSQLHQLRGRVGRGAVPSICFLLAEPTTREGRARTEAMAASTDGFLLAERDLEIRGAGEVFGERQAGFSDLKLGRLPRDEMLVLGARAAAEKILDDDPQLERNEQLRQEVEDLLGDAVEFLFKS